MTTLPVNDLGPITSLAGWLPGGHPDQQII
jgi:hypothetical protein